MWKKIFIFSAVPTMALLCIAITHIQSPSIMSEIDLVCKTQFVYLLKCHAELNTEGVVEWPPQKQTEEDRDSKILGQWNSLEHFGSINHIDLEKQTGKNKLQEAIFQSVVHTE